MGNSDPDAWSSSQALQERGRNLQLISWPRLSPRLSVPAHLLQHGHVMRLSPRWNMVTPQLSLATWNWTSAYMKPTTGDCWHLLKRCSVYTKKRRSNGANIN